jgi:hypothetical protein
VPVAGPELGQLLWIELAGHQGRQLVEEVLEAARRDDLENPAGGVVRIPEGVPLVAWLERQVADLGIDDVVAELRAHSPLEDEAVLVLAFMDMHRRDKRLWRDRVLDQREPASGLFHPGHEADADRPEIHRLAVVGADDTGSLAGVETGPGALRAGLHRSS